MVYFYKIVQARSVEKMVMIELYSGKVLFGTFFKYDIPITFLYEVSFTWLFIHGSGFNEAL